MKTLIYAAALLAVAVGAAPVMAQAVQPVAPNTAVQSTSNAPAWETAVFSADKQGQADGMYNGYGQPNQAYGIPGGNQASPSSHAAP